MNLHIFNPEHDIALAFNRKRFTAPHAAQELRMNLGWIPALWADDGDAVLVDDVDFAVKAASRFNGRKSDVSFVSCDGIRGITVGRVMPWGWDNALKTRLADAGVTPGVMPSDNVMEHIRLLSSRIQTRTAVAALRRGIGKLTCGEAFLVDDIKEIDHFLSKRGKIVVKAPWSGSGRGVRYVDGKMSRSVEGFVKNVIYEQGGVMVEPYYNKVIDFGMEFESLGDGNVVYRGLSLFHTRNGAYTGNLLACEDEKMEMMNRYLPYGLLDGLRSRACRYFTDLLKGMYRGPFGVDMMVVAGGDDGGGFLLHPCVEINLRRTMGHVALALSPAGPAAHRLMHIDHEVNYVLRVSMLENPFVKVL